MLHFWRMNGRCYEAALLIVSGHENWTDFVIQTIAETSSAVTEAVEACRLRCGRAGEGQATPCGSRWGRYGPRADSRV
jgi:hypothetical protein